MAIGYSNPSTCVLGYSIKLNNNAVEAAQDAIDHTEESIQSILECINRFEAESPGHPELPRLYELLAVYQDVFLPAHQSFLSSVISDKAAVEAGSTSYFGSYQHTKRYSGTLAWRYEDYSPAYQGVTVNFERGSYDYGADEGLLKLLENGSGANAYLR